MNAIVDLFRESYKEWSEDKAARLAAALSYYTVFSLVPLLILVISLAGLLGRGDAVQSEIMLQVENLIGQEGREFIQDLIIAASQPRVGIIATVIGTVTLLFGALGVFGQLQESLNTIWEVRPKATKGLGGSLKRLLMTRLLSFTVILGIGFMLLVSLVINAGLAAFQNYLSLVLDVPALVLSGLNFSVSLIAITLLFALMFKILPDAEMSWKDVWLGAAFTAVLFSIGRYAIATYLGQSNINSSFGAAGSMVLILVWVYYSAQIFFMGAEVTQVYANKFGSGIQPDEDAEWIDEQKHREEGTPKNDDQQAGRAAQPALDPAVAAATWVAMETSVGAKSVSDSYRRPLDRPTYRYEEAAFEVESKDALVQGPMVPVRAHASMVEPRKESVVKEIALPMAISWLGALVVGTLVHFSFIRGKKG